MLKEFASLHNHTHFSVFDGLTSPDELVRIAKEKGLRSIAVTDHGVAHAHADVYLAGKKHGMRTVLGVEAYVIQDLDEWLQLKQQLDAERKAKGKESSIPGEELAEQEGNKARSKLLRRKGHLVLNACNRDGLANIYRLIFEAHKFGFYGKPRIDKRMLREHANGLIASSACMGGIIANKLWDLKRGDATWDECVREAREYQDIFGHGRFFLELQFNEHESQTYINEALVKISRETKIPLTVTVDSHYAKQEDWESRELFHMLGAKRTVADTGGKIETEIHQLYLKSPEEMWRTYERFPGAVDARTALEAFQNTVLMDSLIEEYEPDTHQRLPTLPYENPFREVGQRAIAGLKALGRADDEEYKKRLLHELSVIKEKGISNYFLIVQQIVKEAKEKMLVGPGRGSSAGSLVCYSLGITDLDPIEHGLMFERFLDPNRAELPDIDVDFQDVDATKDMLRRMFGDDNVACLSTYGTLQIKGLLKDLGRVFDLDHNEVNKINRQIEKDLRVLYVGQDKSTIVIKLEDVERVSQTFRKFVADNPRVGTHLKTLYGKNRNVGRHASGVIIGDDLTRETAVFVSRDKQTGEGIVQASFTEGIVNKNLSAMGFIKIDILSIANLKVIDMALRLISERTGKPYIELRESLRPHNLALNDPHVLKRVFWDGNFAGIFQFTNKGIRRLSTRMRPETFVDLSALVSIYRPGPLGGGFDKLYVHNKQNPEEVTYEHPLLEDILKKTRGCIVFQEQLMQICNSLGKMSWKDVNRVRKVLLKKDKSKSEEFLKSENDRLAALFFKGCAENGLLGAQALVDAVTKGEHLPEAWTVTRKQVALDSQTCELCARQIIAGDKIALVEQLQCWVHESCSESKNKTLKLWKDLLAFGGYGFNKSLHYNQQVAIYSSDGLRTIKAIRDVVTGDLVLTQDERSGIMYLEPVVVNHDHGELELIEFTMDDGSTVTCTPNHKFRTMDGQMLPISQIMKEDLEIVAGSAERLRGDQILMPLGAHRDTPASAGSKWLNHARLLMPMESIQLSESTN